MTSPSHPLYRIGPAKTILISCSHNQRMWDKRRSSSGSNGTCCEIHVDMYVSGVVVVNHSALALFVAISIFLQ